MVEVESKSKRYGGKQYHGRDGHLTCSGILECLLHCSGVYGKDSCCEGCPGSDEQGVCNTDVFAEAISYFKRQQEQSSRAVEKRRAKKAKI